MNIYLYKHEHTVERKFAENYSKIKSFYINKIMNINMNININGKMTMNIIMSTNFDINGKHLPIQTW